MFSTLVHLCTSWRISQPSVLMNRALLLTISLVFVGTSLLASPAIITLDKTRYTVHEGDGTGSFTIVRTGNEFVSCSIHYRIDGFTPAFYGSVVFAEHDVSKTVTFPIEDDHVYDNRNLLIILETSSFDTFMAYPSVTEVLARGTNLRPQK